MVLDPFCDCATTLVSADRLERNWIGFDISDVTVTLVEKRIREDQGLFQDITARTDVPERDDLGDLPPYNSPKLKNGLHGEQVDKPPSFNERLQVFVRQHIYFTLWRHVFFTVFEGVR